MIIFTKDTETRRRGEKRSFPVSPLLPPALPALSLSKGACRKVSPCPDFSVRKKNVDRSQ